MKQLKVKLTFLEEILGTQPADTEVYSKYIASKAPDAATMEDEVAERGVDAVQDEKMTVFGKLADGTPFLYDYHIKGFFKDSFQMLRRVAKEGYEGAKACGKISAYKKEIDGLVFVEPRRIPIDMHGMKMDVLERPLRAQTPQGERVALAMSETCPEGSTIEFTVTSLKDDLVPALIECFEYGKLRGLGQWRNSGKGKFQYELEEL